MKNSTAASHLTNKEANYNKQGHASALTSNMCADRCADHSTNYPSMLTHNRCTVIERQATAKKNTLADTSRPHHISPNHTHEPKQAKKTKTNGIVLPHTYPENYQHHPVPKNQAMCQRLAI